MFRPCLASSFIYLSICVHWFEPSTIRFSILYNIHNSLHVCPMHTLHLEVVRPPLLVWDLMQFQYSVTLRHVAGGPMMRNLTSIWTATAINMGSLKWKLTAKSLLLLAPWHQPWVALALCRLIAIRMPKASPMPLLLARSLAPSSCTWTRLRPRATLPSPFSGPSLALFWRGSGSSSCCTLKSRPSLS